MAGFEPGQIVIADWRDALPREPNKLRPAIVVEDPELFGPAYPNVILVPLTEDQQLGMPDLSLAKKYLGKDKYPFAQPGEVRVMYEIEPRAANAMG